MQKDGMHDQSVRARADIKYAIKQQMAQLRRYSRAKVQDNQGCSQLIETIIAHNIELYGPPGKHFSQPMRPPSGTLNDYLNLWQDLHCQLHSHFDREAQAGLQEALWTCLYNIRYWIRQYEFGNAQTPSEHQHSLFIQQHDNCENWIHWLADLICIYSEQQHWASQFCQTLSDDELKQLARSFNDKSIQAIFNSLFYYKMHPQALLPAGHSPESLLQCNQQVHHLYSQIEYLFQALQQVFMQRNRLQLPDHLHHGDSIPDSVSFLAKPDHARILQKILQRYLRFDKTVSQPIPQNPALDLLRAYKFWFNPTRLISAIMAIWTRESENTRSTEENRQQFLTRLIHCFDKMTSSECVDLFGYFENKDTRYLLRTLAYAGSNETHPSLPALNPQEKTQIFFVYSLLKTSIEALQMALKNRNIASKFQHETASHKAFNPGKRNLAALNHICEYYCAPDPKRSSELEQLFDAIEKEN